MTHREPILGDYGDVLVGNELADIRRLAEHLQGRRVQHISSTAVGGGVAEILHRLVPLMQEVGLDCSWDVLEGSEDFFGVTKTIHNALHGEQVEISATMFDTYLETLRRNVAKVRPESDVVILHDPQPLGLAALLESDSRKLVWRCHIDISQAHPSVWRFLERFVTRCDAAVYHLIDYTQDLPSPEFVVPPAIDPFSDKNCDLEESEIESVVSKFGIDLGRPIVVQVSRFDWLKDPLGVIEGYRIARRYVDAQLILAGGAAPDDPEGVRVLEKVMEHKGDDPDIFVLDLPPDSHRTINAIQRSADVVVQKSIREGFGLVVSEAMWKGKPVIGGNVGGIRRQVIDGETGYLVHTPEGLAWRLRELLGEPEQARAMGELGKEHVRHNFLLPHYLRNWLMIMLAVDYPGDSIVRLD